MRRKQYLIMLLLLFLWQEISAQAKLKPSKRYESGDVLYGAVAGVKSIVPDGWSGMMPRDSEVFLLLPEYGGDGEIYVTTDRMTNENQRRSNWLQGFELDNGNVLKSDGNIYQRGKSLASAVVLGEKTIDRKAYIEQQCGPSGNCITAILFSSPTDFDKMQQSVMAFMDSLEWVTPNANAEYGDFNWHEFLSGKHLLNHDYVPNAKAENDLWLCADGSFTTKLKRSGLLKEQINQYKGTKKGTWTTTSIGQTGVLILKYDKLPPLEVPLKIEDDRIYLNDKRHFTMLSTICN